MGGRENDDPALHLGEEGSGAFEDKEHRHASIASSETVDDDGSGDSTHSSSVSVRHSPRPARDSEKSEEPDRSTDNGATAAQQGEDLDPEAQRWPEEAEHLPAAVPKPLSERRGVFPRLCVIPEVDEPKHYARRTKWTITAVVAVASIAAPIGSNILLPSLVDIGQELHSTPTVTNLSIALYALALGFFPIFWSSFSEAIGRRSVYVISFGILTVFNVLSALSVNIGMFIVMRILSGGAAGSVQAVGAGTIADIWHIHERGNAMAMYYLGPLTGPLVGPIIGGALQLRFGWRSTMWFNSIYGVVTFLLLVLALPETIAKMKKFGVADTVPPQSATQAADGQPLATSLSRVTSRQSIQQQGKLMMRILNGLFVQPLAIVRYLQFPAVLLTIYYASITFGSLYVLQISIQNTFSRAPYNYSTLIVGLLYIPTSLGYVTSSIFAGKWTDYVMAREARRAGRRDANGKLVYQPEDRMRENMWVAAIGFPLALLWWGWTADKGVFWLVPCIANFIFGMCSMLVFSAVTTMLTEFMPNKAASAIGLNNLCRMTTAAVGIVATQPVIDAIGTGWTFTAVMFIALSSSASIGAMKYYGPKWRLTMDKRMREKGL